MTSKWLHQKNNLFIFTLSERDYKHFHFFFQSYREYHADIFPLTNGLESGPGPSTWWKGSNNGVPKINLDPSKRPQSVLTVFGGALSERDANKVSSENGHTGTAISTSPATVNVSPMSPKLVRTHPLIRPVVPGCAGCAMAHPYFADQLTLFQPGGTDYAHLNTTGIPRFSEVPTALFAVFIRTLNIVCHWMKNESEIIKSWPIISYLNHI